MMEVYVSAILIVVLALVIDAVIGEVPNAVHPLRWMGSIFGWLDRHIKRTSRRATILKGLLSYVLVFAIFFIASFAILSLVRHFFGEWAWIVASAFIFKVSFAIFSFRKHCKPIQKDLANGDLGAAAAKTQMIVSRKTKGMDAAHIASSCTETVSENLVDSVVSPTLYFGIAGVFGSVTFRCANLMDAMWGYLNEEYADLGYFPAKFDDILGFVTSRMSTVFVTIAAFIMRMDWRSVIPMAKAGKNLTPSPNSSWPMVACAAALGIRMEKVGVYVMGEGEMPTIEDVTRCYHLVEFTSVLFVLLVTMPLYATIGVHVQLFIEDAFLMLGGLL